MSANTRTNQPPTPTPHPLTPNPHYTRLVYRYPVDRLWSGGSYGNLDCLARTDRVSNLDGFWLAGSNEWVCGRFDLQVTVAGAPLAAEETRFYPGHQATILAGPGLRAEKTVFVPYGLPPGAGSACYTVLRLQTDTPATARITCDVRWPAVASRSHTKQPERHHVQRRVAQWLAGDTLWARTQPFRVDRWDTVLGQESEARALRGPAGATATFSEPGRARLVYDVALVPGAAITLPFVLVAGSAGDARLRELLDALPDAASALDTTRAAYEAVLTTALVQTPDAQINRGLQWAKANTIRVQHRYRQGYGFTNDPPQDIVVVRDCAWYGLGADWLTPGFARAMHDLIRQYGIHEGGKLTEYFHADTGEREDYALNINDDTPLFVIAAGHHYAVTGDAAFLAGVYPAVHQACEWILAQRRDGLVWCSVQGADVWGNATWRNIIPGYTLAGAVTEINALSYWALLAAADLAGPPAASDAARWREAAAALRAAIADQLGTAEGLYLLNRDGAGANATRTADLVFPVLAGVADADCARRILDLLYSPEFYTPYGIHTVARDETEYHPHFGHGLMGGLWPNLTAWVAYAGRALYPDRLAAMMASVYALSEIENPAAEGHLVPGEFPEWFDGETFESRGMAMSPWMPPTYLWLGVEGLAGVALQPDRLTVEPHMPPDWSWLSVRNLPYQGERFSFFVFAGVLHTTHPVAGSLPQVVYQRDVSDEVAATGGLLVTALEGEGDVALLVAAAAAAAGTVRFRGRVEEVTLASGAATLIHL